MSITETIYETQNDKYYTADEVYSELVNMKGCKSNGLKFEDFILDKELILDTEEGCSTLTNQHLRRNSENCFIRTYSIHNGIFTYALPDATITDFSTDEDEIEIKYYYGNNETICKGLISLEQGNIFIPLDKLTSNRHFILLFTIKNNYVFLYNIYCTVLKDNGLPIGYINNTYHREIKFVIAHNKGFILYNYTTDLTISMRSENPEITMKKTSDYPTLWNEELYVIENKNITYPKDIMTINGKIKPIVYIPPVKFQPLYIKKSVSDIEDSIINRIEPLDFDKDIDFFINYDSYIIRKGLNLKQ